MQPLLMPIRSHTREFKSHQHDASIRLLPESAAPEPPTVGGLQRTTFKASLNAPPERASGIPAALPVPLKINQAVFDLTYTFQHNLGTRKSQLF